MTIPISDLKALRDFFAAAYEKALDDKANPPAWCHIPPSKKVIDECYKRLRERDA